jgi:hypothetical protein
MTMLRYKQGQFNIVCHYRDISFDFLNWKFETTVLMVVHLIDSASVAIRLYIYVQLGGGFMTMLEFKQGKFIIVCHYREISFEFLNWKFETTVLMVVHLIDSTKVIN